MMIIEGDCDPRYRAVRVAFERNFVDGRETGAGCCVYEHGRPVVDLWAGTADAAGERPWRADTVAGIASVTKTLAATALPTLVERGRIALDRPVADTWPEFAAEGKESVTVRDLLSHRSGVVSLAHRPITLADEAAGTPIMDAIAAARPEWPPGSAHGYHGLTLGHALSAIVLRLTGRTVGRYLAAEIAGPLGLDCWIGLPDAELPRLAELITPTTAATVQLGAEVAELQPLHRALSDAESPTYRAMYGSMAFGWESTNDPRATMEYELVSSPTKEAIRDMVQTLGYKAVVLRPQFRSYVGSRRYENGLRRAFLCAKQTDLSKLRVPIEGWEEPTRWFHAPVWYAYRLVQKAREKGLPGFRTPT